jgi:hypothetical protein
METFAAVVKTHITLTATNLTALIQIYPTRTIILWSVCVITGNRSQKEPHTGKNL